MHPLPRNSPKKKRDAPILDVERHASTLDWRQFEELASILFKKFNFEVFLNYRMKKPRLEVDLLAVQRTYAFAVDCKHWKRTVGSSVMSRISEKQLSRCQNILPVIGAEQIIPVILTWHDEQLEILVNGVPIVPIQKLGNFILNWESFSDRLCIIH